MPGSCTSATCMSRPTSGGKSNLASGCLDILGLHRIEDTDDMRLGLALGMLTDVRFTSVASIWPPETRPVSKSFLGSVR